MKAVLEAVYSKYAGTTPLYLGIAPQGQDYPYITLNVISGNPEFTFDSRTDFLSLQFSCFSDNSSAEEVLTTMTDDIFRIYDDCTLSVSGEQFIKMERRKFNMIREPEYWHGITEYLVRTHNEL